MKGYGIQLNDNIEGQEVMDLKIQPIRSETGLIEKGIVLGNILQQNKAMILIAQPNDFKHAPQLGVGIEDILLTDDLLEFRHRVREHFAKDGLKITKLDMYDVNRINIEANYE